MHSIKKILVATDFTDIGDHAVAYAVDLAKQLAAKLTIVHAYELPIYTMPDGVVFATPELASQIATVAQKSLDARIDKQKASGVSIDGVLRFGTPADEVHKLAEEIDVDLIVVGTHGRTGLSRALLGSTAEMVIRTATRPVVAVHAKDAV